MTAASATAAAIADQRHLNLSRYLLLTAGPHALALAGLLLLAWLRPSAPVVLVLAVVTCNSLITVIAYRLARRGRLQQAIGLYAGSMVLLTAALLAFGTQLYAVATALAFIPVMMAMPYVSVRGVLLAAVLVSLLFTAGAISQFLVPPLTLDFPHAVLDALIAVSVCVIAAVTLLTLWYNARLLHRAVGRAGQLHEQLKASEQALEAQVQSRTGELAAANQALVRARDAAQALDAQTNEFLAKMSHELRTPLNAVIGFSDLLLARYFGPLNDKQAEYVGDIHSSAQHLLLLINDILDLSKVATGQLAIERRPFDLDAMLDSALLLVAHRAGVRGVDLRRAWPVAIGSVHGDERKLKQVLINLLGNAVKFTESGGRIVLGARREAGGVALWVEDSGCGIAAEDQARIFEPFRQARDSAQRGEGTGLGLSLSRRIVELHGGSLVVSSTPGRGSRFSFTLPTPEQDP